MEFIEAIYVSAMTSNWVCNVFALRWKFCFSISTSTLELKS